MTKTTNHRKASRTKWIKVRITHYEAQELSALARQDHLSRSQFIARIISEWGEQRQERKRLAAERQLGELSA